jgi:hypothetical protein
MPVLVAVSHATWRWRVHILMITSCEGAQNRMALVTAGCAIAVATTAIALLVARRPLLHTNSCTKHSARPSLSLYRIKQLPVSPWTADPAPGRRPGWHQTPAARRSDGGAGHVQAPLAPSGTTGAASVPLGAGAQNRCALRLIHGNKTYDSLSVLSCDHIARLAPKRCSARGLAPSRRLRAGVRAHSVAPGRTACQGGPH